MCNDDFWISSKYRIYMHLYSMYRSTACIARFLFVIHVDLKIQKLFTWFSEKWMILHPKVLNTKNGLFDKTTYFKYGLNTVFNTLSDNVLVLHFFRTPFAALFFCFSWLYIINYVYPKFISIRIFAYPFLFLFLLKTYPSSGSVFFPPWLS